MSFSIPADINSWDRLRTAEFYHRDLGWAIHALCPPNRGQDHERGKKPIAKGWRSHNAAEVTPDYLREHFANGSNFNLGVVVRGPFVHVDLDSKPDAGESVRTWLNSQPQLATIPRERTGGGAHLVFVCRDLPEPVAKAKKAITAQVNANVTAEFYTDGMNLVLSPSVHKSGARYVWDVTGEIPEVSWAQIRQWFGFDEPAEAKRGRPQKEKPWWCGFKGALHSLDAVALFKEVDLLGDCIDPDAGKWSVRCPWEAEHSGAKGGNGSDTDTVIFQGETADSPPGFKCLHAHCAERSLKEVLETLDLQKPGIVDRHCREMRVWTDGQTSPDGRQRVLLPEMDRPDSEFAAEMGQQIGPRKAWFNKAETVVAVAQRRFSENITVLGFHPVQPVEACTAAEQFVQTGVLREDKATGDMIFLRHTMTRECASKLMASPQFRRKLPEIIRILDIPLPIRTSDGRIVFPETGYDPRFRSYLDPEAPKIRPMPFDRAIELIQEVHADFGWKDGQSLVHALARMITPICRGLMGWDARFPLWHYSGNRPRAGKDYLAGVTQLLYEGRTCEDAPLERESEETRKRITAAISSGRRMMHFANCQGYIQDAVFIGSITSKTFGARNLGSTEAKADLTLPNEIEFSISANVGLTFREDVEPRTRRISLVFFDENPNGRDFKKPDLHGWVLKHRGELLSALGALVKRWIDCGCPAGPTPFNSFPEWGRVVGGIMHACNLGDPCLPHTTDDSEVGGDRQDRAMRALYRLMFENHPDTWIEKGELFRLVSASDDEDLAFFGSFEEGQSKDAKKRIGMTLRQFRDRELGGVVLEVDAHGKGDRQQVRFSAVGAKGRSSEQILLSIFGNLGNLGKGYSRPLVSEEKCGEKKEYMKELKTREWNGGRGVSEVSEVSTFGARSDFPEIAAAITSAGSVALDIETFGTRKTDALNPWRGEIRLLSLKIEGCAPWLIDLQSTGYDLGPLSTALETALVIGHNLKFDALWLGVKCGLRLPRVFCTLVAARLLSAGTRPGNDLDKCLERYLGIKPADDHSRSDWGGMFLTDGQLAYAARDVAHLHALYDVLTLKLEQSGLGEVAGLEMDLQPVIVAMETAGLAVDRAKLESIRDQAKAESEMQTAALRDALGDRQINLSSPAQLQAALAKAGLTLANTNEETLKASGDERFVPIILAHRSAEKTAQQAQSLLECIADDGRIHGRFDPTGTATGRFSSREPNLQNIGRGPLRECFIAPEGTKLVVADYSQIELRAAAAIAGETKMIEAYQRGEDLHRLTAATVLGKQAADVTKEERQMAKACFSGDTEILTERGWVRFDAYDGTAPVAQFSLPDGVAWNPPRPRSNRWGHPTGKVQWDGCGTIEFTRPLDFRRFEDREVIAHEDRNTNLLLTPDHEVAFITNNGNPTKRRADEVTPGNCRHLIAAGTLARTPVANELLTRALAMVVADGSFANGAVIRFGFSKERKVWRCLNLLKALGIEPQISIRCKVTSITVRNEEFVQQLLVWISRRKDLSWDCLSGLDATVYLDEAAHWDGTQIEGLRARRVIFTTTSTQTANVMQAMAATSGIPSTLSVTTDANPLHAPIHRLSYRLGGMPLWRASWNTSPVPERQTVYCVHVPSGAILIRREGKVCVQGNCNFGLLYGQSAPGLVKYAASSYGVTLPEDDAKEIRAKFFRTYGSLRQWHGESHRRAEQGVREIRTVLGRRRLIPQEASAWERFTALVNTPVQGGCADGMKRALVQLATALPPSARIVSTVHDEIIVEAPEHEAEGIRRIVEEVMIEAMAALFPQVPVEVESNVCASWGDK